MAITELVADGIVLARHIPAADAWGSGLQFFSESGEFAQVGTWVYDKNKQLAAHQHNEVARSVLWTQEILFIKNGKLKAEIYDLNQKKIGEIIASEGDILALLQGGHGYQILSDDTQVLEVKNGPYLGPEIDRKRF